MIELTDEMKASHALISPEFAEFMERVAANPEEITHIDREGKLQIMFNYPMIAWPLFGDGRFRAMVEKATTSVMHLCSLVPERIFADDMETFAEMFGFASAEDARNVVVRPNGMDLAMSRPDFLLTADGFKCMETNTSPSLGGAFTHLWREEYLKLPHVKQYMDERGLDPLQMDATKGFLQLLLDLTEDLREEDVITVGLAVDQPLPNDEVGVMFNGAMTGYLKEIGVDLTPDFVQAVLPPKTEAEASPGEIYVKDGLVWVDGKRIHLLLGDLAYHANLMEAFRSGKVVMLNSPASFLMTDKRFIALLSHHVDRFSPEEQELIKAYIPWSRLVLPGETTYKDETVDLETLLRENREEFVLKSAKGMKGEQVIVGRKVDDTQWDTAVREAFDDGEWMVQEVLDSIPFLGKGEGEAFGPHQLVWGFFCYNGQLKGTFVRSQNLASGSGIINSASGAMESILMFIP